MALNNNNGNKRVEGIPIFSDPFISSSSILLSSYNVTRLFDTPIKGSGYRDLVEDYGSQFIQSTLSKFVCCLRRC